MCILFGILLTVLTEKSGSVWSAAIMHAVVNMHPGILVGYVNPDKADGMRAAIAREGGIIAMVIVAAVMLLISRKNLRQ
jgi:membrane protease YdiL (CAAX protease family)